jgi:hypothetical protein
VKVQWNAWEVFEGYNVLWKLGKVRK